MAAVQAQVRQQVLRACVRRDLLEQGDADAMGGWDHSGGFSLDASVHIEGADRAGRERLLRYCARPPFALDHLHQHDAGCDIERQKVLMWERWRAGGIHSR